MPSYILKQKRLLFIVFLIVAILIGVKWYFIVILICISLMIIDAEHLYPLAICTSFFGGKKISIQALFPVFNCFFFFYSELYECFVYFGYLSLVRCIVCKYILPFGRLPFCFVEFPFTVQCFLVWHSTIGLFLLLPASTEKTYPKLVLQSVYCLFFSRSFIVSGLTVKSLSHFEFTFVYGMIN